MIVQTQRKNGHFLNFLCTYEWIKQNIGHYTIHRGGIVYLKGIPKLLPFVQSREGREKVESTK